jgi:dTDP-glucose 4,6-dehydratase
MTKTLLITGGAGFIGVNFVRYWREKHPADKIVVLDALTYAGNAASLNGVDGALLVQADIRDFDQNLKLMIEHSVDTVVHFAAESHVDRSIHGQERLARSVGQVETECPFSPCFNR